MDNVEQTAVVAVDQGEWPNYFFFSDFKEHQELLSAMPLGELSEENKFLLAAILNDVDNGVGKNQWKEYPSEEWSVAGVEIIYSGRNAQRLPTRWRPDSTAIGLKFPPNSLGPIGTIYITYSNPTA